MTVDGFLVSSGGDSGAPVEPQTVQLVSDCGCMDSCVIVDEVPEEGATIEKGSSTWLVESVTPIPGCDIVTMVRVS